MFSGLLFYADGSGHVSDGSGHMSDLGFSDAAVSLARHLADSVLSVSWSLWPPSSWLPQSPLSLLALLGSQSFVALSLLCLFYLFSLFWISG